MRKGRVFAGLAGGLAIIAAADTATRNAKAKLSFPNP